MFYAACLSCNCSMVCIGASLPAKLTSIFICMSKSTFTMSMKFMLHDNFEEFVINYRTLLAMV